MRSKNSKTKAMALMLSLTVLMGVMTVSASAAAIQPNSLGAMSTGLDSDGREYKYLSGLNNKGLWNYERVSVSVGQRTLSVKGFVHKGVYYIPFRAAADAISGSSYSYNSGTRTSTMRAPGLEIVAGDGCFPIHPVQNHMHMAIGFHGKPPLVFCYYISFKNRKIG